MKYAGIEAAYALNQRPGPTGVSAGMMLFGQRLKQYGELYANGEPAYHHLSGTDGATELGRRMQIRCSAKQATEAHYAKEMVRKTVAARTRTVTKVEVGELVFFYRCYPSVKHQQLQAQRGCYLGPGVVIGYQKQNAWVSYAGRCYLVAPEHLRTLAPDEVFSAKPLIRAGLEEFRRATNAKDFVDISNQSVPEGELDRAADTAPGDDHTDAMETTPTAPAEAPEETGKVEEVLEPAVEEVESNVASQIQQQVELHLDDASATETAGEKRKQEDSQASTDGGRAVSWRPHGDDDTLRWNKRSRGVNFSQGKKIMTEKLKKKMLDKEVPYKDIPVKDLDKYHEAESKEWQDWMKNKSVKILKGADAKQVIATTDPRRIINLRFVYRDKNASIRTPQTPLPVRAKARLCAQASREPTAMEGLAKLDSPTVQRVGMMIF